MVFIEDSFYHIYNRGNDKGIIFRQERNYDYFLDKIGKYILPSCNLLAWCLMPTHFHFLLQANASSIAVVKENPIQINSLTEGIRLLLSSYTKGIQVQESITGNLFQQKTKSKCVDDYLQTAFHYIHQNPLRANLVKRLEDWTWSSLQEYIGATTRAICTQEIAYSHLDFEKKELLETTYRTIPSEFVLKLF